MRQSQRKLVLGHSDCDELTEARHELRCLS